MIGNCDINKQSWEKLDINKKKGSLSPITLIFKLDIEIRPTALAYQQSVGV